MKNNFSTLPELEDDIKCLYRGLHILKNLESRQYGHFFKSKETGQEAKIFLFLKRFDQHYNLKLITFIDGERFETNTSFSFKMGGSLFVHFSLGGSGVIKEEIPRSFKLRRFIESRVLLSNDKIKLHDNEMNLNLFKSLKRKGSSNSKLRIGFVDNKNKTKKMIRLTMIYQSQKFDVMITPFGEIYERDRGKNILLKNPFPLTFKL